MSESHAPPQRIRAADLIAEQRTIIAALLERGGGEHSSVVLTRNSKGDTQIEVTVRTDGETIVSADEAFAKACELYDAACTKYPPGETSVNGTTAKPGRAKVQS
jgi:hypothetical protein